MIEQSPAGVDLTCLGDWMDDEGLPEGPIQGAELLGGGTQNILLRFSRGGEHYVLRRPPVHKRKNSDETMRREARVLAALRGTRVPHPELIAACSEIDVLGAAFYLMEPIEGFNVSMGLPEFHRTHASARRRMGLSMVDAIAELGALDYQEVGLADFGKPEGYLERQVPRWRSQLDSYCSFEGYSGPEIPGVDEVARWLEDERPSDFRPGIIHGDFHLLNVMFQRESPELAAVVDWELSTIGDPLLDLGWMLATWPDGGGGSPVSQSIDGLATPAELVEQYRGATSRNLDTIAWYEVLACYKLGIILEGSNARACAGQAPKSVGDLLHAQTLDLFSRATQRIAAR